MRVWLPDGTGADITVTGLSRADWSVLLQEHPPREGEEAWNEATFAPALIAACTGFTIGEATVFWDESPIDAAEDLFSECLRTSNPGSYEWAVRRLRRNGRLAAEVALCVQMGLPHSVFTAWSDRDQDLALASASLERDHCPGCGAPEAAMSDPSKADVIVRTCWMCQARDAQLEAIPPEQRSHTHVMVVPAGGAS